MNVYNSIIIALGLMYLALFFLKGWTLGYYYLKLVCIYTLFIIWLYSLAFNLYHWLSGPIDKMHEQFHWLARNHILRYIAAVPYGWLTLLVIRIRRLAAITGHSLEKHTTTCIDLLSNIKDRLP